MKEGGKKGKEQIVEKEKRQVAFKKGSE